MPVVSPKTIWGNLLPIHHLVIDGLGSVFTRKVAVCEMARSLEMSLPDWLQECAASLAAAKRSIHASLRPLLRWLVTVSLN